MNLLLLESHSQYAEDTKTEVQLQKWQTSPQITAAYMSVTMKKCDKSHSRSSQ